MNIFIISVSYAQFKGIRKLSATEVKTAIDALMSNPVAKLNSVPSCKSDLSQPDEMTIADGLALALTIAANEQKKVVIRVDCFVRPGYPVSGKQEWCRVAFLPNVKSTADGGYGLAFLMDWANKIIVPGSVECY
jgi:hypothetical protein